MHNVDGGTQSTNNLSSGYIESTTQELRFIGLTKLKMGSTTCYWTSIIEYLLLIGYIHLHSALKAYETLHNGQYDTHSGNESNLVVSERLYKLK